MSARRKQILKELGLTPMWHLKSTVPTHGEILASQPNEINKSAALPDPAQDLQRPQEIQQMNWEQLKLSASHCTACPLSQARTQTVFGVGDENADWLFVGEGPGAREDATGEPFVGQAGKLLDQMLAAIGLKRDHQVYIANIVKCRPPNNRNPSLNEARQCEPYLTRQIELIKPKLIIALGKIAAQNLLGCEDSISNLRGKVHDHSGIPLIVTYHPAYLLRALPEKAKAWKDLCFAQSTMQSIK
ncbi:DNA polymerase [Nitrosomonas sp. Nm84]|uniref:uracil-DNA glycosylase n=1 Tax=Nitrosomonas sp. Nm84 TaxID=200124 RepID=UPI000D752D2E|nr:uracil-DNA glycosylase [Nitrosomonas sp. Nm84]PXW90799.1 DNA polymerase [Nitrosomonas sp. Nm84]